ncbi:MAG: CHASE2 domain-containing protein, partial [Chloroflexi bacterium]
CSSSMIDSFALAAYRADIFGTDFKTEPDIAIANGKATFGSAWSTPVDESGSVLINFSGPPDNFKDYGRYISFADVINGTADPQAIQGKIVLVGYDGLAGVNDEKLVTTSFGLNKTLPMPGVEIHANVVQMLLNAVDNPNSPSRFLKAEPPWLLLALLIVLTLATAVGVARVTVLWGLIGTVLALGLFTFGMSASTIGFRISSTPGSRSRSPIRG